jgi:phosphoribosylformimino-5-aminoimidazole carboxamide ribotide isomerase
MQHSKSYRELPRVIVPVLDVRDGVAVQAIAGNRQQYQAVVSKQVAGSDPRQIAQALVEQVGAKALYVADLDSLIAGTAPSRDLLESLCMMDLQIWYDADWQTDHKRLQVLSDIRFNRFRPILSLETTRSLPNFKACIQLWQSIAQHTKHTESATPIFSLDLFAGKLQCPDPALASSEPLHILREVRRLGCDMFICLDIAQVGTGSGPQGLSLLREIKQAFPEIQLISGGGIRSMKDVQQFVDAGCDHVLVATALHQGQLELSDI